MIILTGASASGKTVTALKLMEKYGFVKALLLLQEKNELTKPTGSIISLSAKRNFSL